jgi:hypothetical protein
MINNLEFISLGLIIIIIGSGAYTQIPGLGYIFPLLLLAVLMFDRDFFKNQANYVNKKMVIALFILILFFSIQLLLNRIIFNGYLFYIIAMSIMFITYTVSRTIILRTNHLNLYFFYGMSSIVFLTLALILAGQFAQMLGYIVSINFDGAQFDKMLTLSRPGGFLNPNESAAIALVLCYIAYNLSNFVGIFIYSISIIPTVLIILISQSRAAILLLIIMVCFTIKFSIRRMVLILIFLMTFSLISFYYLNDYSSEMMDLLINSLDRFEGDDGSDERFNVIKFGLDAFVKSPIFGNGASFSTENFGISTHNQPLEIASSYGIFGILVLGLVIWWTYFPSSIFFKLFCFIPFFMFSHNFMESAALQSVLGLALALDRASLKKNV